jgi:hypothetical protein
MVAVLPAVVEPYPVVKPVVLMDPVVVSAVPSAVRWQLPAVHVAAPPVEPAGDEPQVDAVHG